jgi:hypothetical protein
VFTFLGISHAVIWRRYARQRNPARRTPGGLSGLLIGIRATASQTAWSSLRDVGPAMASRPCQNYGFNVLETAVRGVLAKYAIMTDNLLIASDIPAACINIRFPPSPRLARRAVAPGEWSPMPVWLRRAERRAVSGYWELLQRLVARHVKSIVLDRIDQCDPDDGWCIHFICADPATVIMLHNIATAERGPGDLLDFDAAELVRHWLRRLEDRFVETLTEAGLAGRVELDGNTASNCGPKAGKIE